MDVAPGGDVQAGGGGMADGGGGATQRRRLKGHLKVGRAPLGAPLSSRTPERPPG
eukprot:XP_001692190.1 predicted protein [Chlamydomonas reinhardtii]